MALHPDFTQSSHEITGSSVHGEIMATAVLPKQAMIR